MTIPVEATGAAASSAESSNGTRASSLSGLSSDQFLKLLIAQLKYQDPSNPSDPNAFMEHTAAFTQIETLQKIENQLANEIVAQQTSGAFSLIGKTITGKGSEATADITGVVTSVGVGTKGPVIHIGDVEVPYSSITEVKPSK